MSGKKLLRLSKKEIPPFMEEFFLNLNTKMTDIDVIIPHQASKLGLAMFKNIYNFKENQLKESLDRYGNCIAASIPLTMSDCIDAGELKRGDTCLLTGTSAGFSIGAALITY